QGAIQVSFQTTFTNGTVHYTLDGSMPSMEAVLYTAPFLLTKSATLRAIAYSADSSQSAEAGPIQVVITVSSTIPRLTFTKSNGTLLFSWPATDGFDLEQTTEGLGSPWIPVTGAIVVGDQKIMEVSV